MAQSKVAALLRLTLALALIASLMVTARGVLAEAEGDGGGGGGGKKQDQKQERAQEEAPADEPLLECPPGTAVCIHGGNHSTEHHIDLNADGGAGNADAQGGDLNTASTGGGGVDATANGDVVGDTAASGNGGTATADASGGTLYSPTDADGNPIPIANTGGNQGSTINVEGVVAGDGNTRVEIYGGDSAITTDVTMNITGGIADADAFGGDANVATVLGGADDDILGSLASAGNGGTADASATGGFAPVGTILGGNNRGAVINVGQIIGGTGNAGDVTVRIHGGTLSATTVAEIDVAVGGFASADGTGGNGNFATVVGGTGDIAAAGNGGDGDASANGGIVTIGAVDGDLYSIIGGNNRGATIDLAGVGSGSGTAGGVGGDATVGIYGGDLTANAQSIGSPAYAGGNSGADIDAGFVVAGDGSWHGSGGDATLLIDGGSILASAGAPAGADAGDNRGADITAGNVLGGDGVGGAGGDATVAIEGSDISAVGFGLEIVGVDSGAPVIDLAWDGAGASAGDGGIAVASADAGSARTGPVFAGDNYGGDITVGDTIGGDGLGGNGGDATVHVVGTDISTSFIVNVAVDGGTAGASAAGGADNAALAPADGSIFPGGGSAAAGSGGFASASADGGDITVGTIYVGGNHGGVVSVGDTIGGTGSHGGQGGNALVSLDGGSITAGVILNLEALGGAAFASADGGDDNLAILLGDGSLDLGAYAGTGGIALADANGGTIVIGDVHVGGNLGAVMSVGDVVGGDGSWGGVGGDATLTVQGTDIVSIIQLDLQANGGIAAATADGGDRNTAFFDATDATDLAGIDLLAGVGGIAQARANGGTIVVGDLFAGGNVGTVVDFGDIVAGDGHGSHGRSEVFHRFSGELITVVHIQAESHGGAALASADGGDDNFVALIADGTTTIGVPRAGNGGTVLAEANGGPITIGNVTSGNNLGAVFVGPVQQGGHDRHDDGKPAPSVHKPGVDKPGPGKPGAGGRTITTPAGKGGRGKVRALPSTGDGSGLVAGATDDALLAVGTLLALAGVGYGLRRRIA